MKSSDWTRKCDSCGKRCQVDRLVMDWPSFFCCLCERARREAMRPQRVNSNAKNAPGAGYPYYSDAMGCAHDQVAEQHEALAKCGVSADITPDGRIKVESRGHRDRLMRAMGLHDRNDVRSPRNR